MGERIAVVVPNLVLGGVQRSGIAIAEMLARDHEVSLLSLGPGPMADGYEGPVDMRIGAVPRNRAPWTRLQRQLWLRRTLAEVDPSVVVSLTPGPTTMALAGLAGRRRRTRVVYAERNDYRVKRENPGVRAARAVAFRAADHVVVQTEALAVAVAERPHAPPTTVIPNALPPGFGRDEPEGARHQPRVLWVGRVVPQKRADHALRAFAAVAPDRPGWSFDVVGDGPLREGLEELASELGVSDRVTFHGAVRDPGPHYATASVLLLTSHHEGFPNVLIEAMAHGVPVVTYDCPSGPAEIVRDGRGGVLVADGDLTAATSALRDLTGDAARVERLGREAVEAVEGFTYDGVGDRWRALVAAVAAAR